jgi:anti-sigma-K factor RskA
MIDERDQELAALYALDLLEGDELRLFKASVENNADLATLVRELRETSAGFALSTTQVGAPPELKGRIMDRLSDKKAAAAATSKTIPFPMSVLIPWTIAAGLAIGCGWLSQLYFATRSEALQLSDGQMLSQMEVRGAQLQVEAERVIAQRDIADAKRQIADLNRTVATTAEEIAKRDQQIASLNEQLQAQGDLAQFKIATLASMAGNSPQALAIAVWNPKTQEGVLSVAKLPALASDKDYQLWLIDPAYPAPVDGGVFTVNPATGDARINFKPNQRVNNAAKFAVSLERKGGVKKAEGPIVLLGD